MPASIKFVLLSVKSFEILAARLGAIALASTKSRDVLVTFKSLETRAASS